MRTARPPRPGLTGIAKLKGRFFDDPAIFCCAGTSLSVFDSVRDSVPNDGWPIFAVNGAIRKTWEIALGWVLADIPIVHEYAHYCREWTRVFAMHEAGPECLQNMRHPDIWTVESTSEAKTYDDGVNFFSRGTVLIGALEMARYMGITRAYVFGLDCYRREDAYYYDRRKPTVASEARPSSRDEIHGLPFKAYVTPRLRRMIQRLDEARAAGLWHNLDVWCVGSPHSQQRAIPKMTLEEFREVVNA